MARKKKVKSPPFAMLPWELISSQAFIALPPSAGKALPYFIWKAGRTERAKGERVFEFSYSEAGQLGFAKRTFSRIIDDLIANGFLEMAGYGGLRGFCKSNNKFALSDRWRDYGRREFRNVPRYPAEPPVEQTPKGTATALKRSA